jgi:hypothetical protein
MAGGRVCRQAAQATRLKKREEKKKGGNKKKEEKKKKKVNKLRGGWFRKGGVPTRESVQGLGIRPLGGPRGERPDGEERNSRARPGVTSPPSLARLGL